MLLADLLVVSPSTCSQSKQLVCTAVGLEKCDFHVREAGARSRTRSVVNFWTAVVVGVRRWVLAIYDVAAVYIL